MHIISTFNQYQSFRVPIFQCSTVATVADGAVKQLYGGVEANLCLKELALTLSRHGLFMRCESNAYLTKADDFMVKVAAVGFSNPNPANWTSPEAPTATT